MAFPTRSATASGRITILLIVSIAAALAVPLAAEASSGVVLGWRGSGAGSCPMNSLSYQDYAGACDNTGSATIVGAILPPPGLTQVVSEEFSLSFEFAAPEVPDFWRLEPSGCRDGSLLVSAVFTGFATGSALTQCSDYWGTSASGSAHWTSGTFWGSSAELHGTYARPSATAGPMTAGHAYYAFQTNLDLGHAAADPNDPSYAVCSGCQIPACIVFCWAYLRQPAGVGDHLLTASSSGYRDLVTWQSGAGTISCPGEWGNYYFCADAPTPARRSTWGQLRSLYR